MKSVPPPRRVSWLLLLFLCSGPSGLVRSEDEIEKAFRDALYAEEVKGDSEAALKAYQEVGKKFDTQRDMAATALFRQGECLRKLGRKEEAAAAYNKVLTLYGDRERVAKLSRENLTALGLPAPVPNAAGPAPAATVAKDPDTEEIARLQKIAENSPDLLAEVELSGAAENGSPAVVSWILDKLPKPLSADRLNAALEDACRPGHLKVCQVLLDAGANPNGAYFPLWTALESNRLEVMKLLLSRKADVDVRREIRNSEAYPLEVKLPEEVRTMFETGLRQGPFDVKNGTPLMAAILSLETSAEAMDILLKNKASVNVTADLSGKRATARDANGYEKQVIPPPFPLTPLGAAIITRNVTGVQKLLAAKADPNKAFGDAAMPPLLFALAMQSSRDPNDKPGQQKTEEIIKALLGAGADWKATLSNGVNALHLCARLDMIPWLEQAIKAGINVNAQDKTGNTALHQAVRAASAEGVRRLLAAGAKTDPEADDSGPATPLLIACAASKRDDNALSIVRMLLDAGADPNRQKKNGDLPLAFAVSGWLLGNVWAPAADILVEKGARPGDAGLLKPNAWLRNGPDKPDLSKAVRETFRKVWQAAHWRDNPRLAHAVWLSQSESLMNFGLQPKFIAVLCDDAAVSRPPTLREFFSMDAPMDLVNYSTLPTLGIDWMDVTIIRTRDGKQERLPVDMKEFAADPGTKDIPLEWGDVVETGVAPRVNEPVRREAEQRIIGEFPFEIRVQPANDRCVVTAASRGENLLQAGLRSGLPNASQDRDFLRLAGTTNLLFQGFSVMRTDPHGELKSENSYVRHGDVLLMRPVPAVPKPDDRSLLSSLWLCQNVEGPYWSVPVPRTVDDKPVPLAGLVVALLGPQPLPSACFDWDKATVRWYGPPPAKAPEPSRRERVREKEKDSEKDAPAAASVWNEKKLLDAWPTLRMQPGMVITLPPAERDNFEPPVKLRAALTGALATDWVAVNHSEEEVPGHYEPRFFKGEKKDNLWIWSDLDPAKASGPLLPVAIDLMAAEPRSGYGGKTGYGGDSKMSVDVRGAGMRPLDNGDSWLTGSGSKLQFN